MPQPQTDLDPIPGPGHTGLDRFGNLRSGSVTIAPDAIVLGSDLRDVRIEAGARVVGCSLIGDSSVEGGEVVVEENADLFSCQARTKASTLGKRFAFSSFQVEATPTRIGKRVRLGHSLIVNSEIGEGTSGSHAVIRCSRVGRENDLRSSSNLILTSTGRGCNLGSEISKTILGDGFVSEHTGSYLSLVAPSRFPILDESGAIDELELPNATNIGAGTVFANYGGDSLPATTIDQSPGSKKGTALVFAAFTCINTRIVNRYGQPPADATLHELYRHKDVTRIGLASFAENKVTGAIPAFSYCGDRGIAGAKGHRIGWVLDQRPGILLTLIRKMQKTLGDDRARIAPLVEGTIRLEIDILEAERDRGSSSYEDDQLRKGLEILKNNLDGRWRMNAQGKWLHPWSASEDGSWTHSDRPDR